MILHVWRRKVLCGALALGVSCAGCGGKSRSITASEDAEVEECGKELQVLGSEDDLDLLEGVSVLRGNLLIKASEDLEPLRCLTLIDGSLHVWSSDTGDLRGLERLAEVTGNIDIQGVKSPEGLDGLTRVGGIIWILVAEMRDLSMFASLVDAGGLSLQASGVETLDGLSKLERLGRLSLYNEPHLRTIGSLGSVTELTEGLSVFGSHELADLNGSERLERMGGLSLEQNKGLQSLSGLARVRSIGGDVRILDNALSQCEVDRLIAEVGRENIAGSITAFGNRDGQPCPL
jgi:hypothetical protein